MKSDSFDTTSETRAVAFRGCAPAMRVVIYLIEVAIVALGLGFPPSVCALTMTTLIAPAIADLNPVIAVVRKPTANRTPTANLTKTLQEVEGPYRGTWTIDGGQGTAQWDNGARADLTIERFDESTVVIGRTDNAGSSVGLTATYTGRREGNSIVSSVTWIFPNGRTMPGTWRGKKLIKTLPYSW